MEKNSGSGGVQSLDRAFDLLELLCRSQNGMAIHQLSEITGLHHMDRGYYGLEDTLRGLGADIVRVP